MVKLDRNRNKEPRSLGDFSRTRRARLVAEFEHDLGVDHLARLKSIARKRRLQFAKTVAVWCIALTLFGISLYQLWHIGQHTEEPFSNLGPLIERFR